MSLRPTVAAIFAAICMPMLAMQDAATPTATIDEHTTGPAVALGPFTGYTVDVGAGQGVSVIGEHLYIYGDADTGIIREYELDAARRGDLVPTGRVLRLTVDGEDVAAHPTGLTSLDGRTVILGDTVAGVGQIFWLDWDAAWERGTLDGAILHRALDDAAVNGTRPHYARYQNRWLLATSDYGSEGNAIRLYDPKRLRAVENTSADGVLVASVPCTPYVQNVHWLDETGTLVLIQNQVAGLRYRFTFVALEEAIAAGDARDAPFVDLDEPTDELEGFATLGGGMCVMTSAMREHNVWIGMIRFR
ncbi:MAG: hypothetical protein AAFX79_10215 [Planctomycetota bacterium]